jgi:S-DNA-T family DNA segregation ATPase FtsK/SpoIIIE
MYQPSVAASAPGGTATAAGRPELPEVNSTWLIPSSRRGSGWPARSFTIGSSCRSVTTAFARSTSACSASTAAGAVASVTATAAPTAQAPSSATSSAPIRRPRSSSRSPLVTPAATNMPATSSTRRSRSAYVHAHPPWTTAGRAGWRSPTFRTANTRAADVPTAVAPAGVSGAVAAGAVPGMPTRVRAAATTCRRSSPTTASSYRSTPHTSSSRYVSPRRR